MFQNLNSGQDLGMIFRYIMALFKQHMVGFYEL